MLKFHGREFKVVLSYGRLYIQPYPELPNLILTEWEESGVKTLYAMRSLYYYLGRLEQKHLTPLLDFLHTNPNITPIISYIRDSTEIILFVLVDWKGADEVVWKKFKDPGLNKYITARFYKARCLKEREELESWKIEERISYYHSINYNLQKILYIQGTKEEEIMTLKEIAAGNVTIFPFELIKDKQILIL